MKKNIIIIVIILFVSLVFLNSSYAQLKKDIQYIRGKVVSVDVVKKILVVSVGEKKSDQRAFDISISRINGELSKGQDVYIIVPLNSNQAKSIRILNK